MKAVFNLETDTIESFGSAYEDSEGENIFAVPDDYSPDKYDYIPKTSGIYDPDGFKLIVKPINPFEGIGIDGLELDEVNGKVRLLKNGVVVEFDGVILSTNNT